ncbi:MAG: PEP-CTERM sorting domain-containing protein [Oscillatoriales cyanobacterium]|nr:MAG: PEP-CTERM sorting domain-containing protein [Oscillatoriales cyanobacterium]
MRPTMNQKQRQRLGSAIASTILSLAAVSLVGVDKAQAAVLTYNFQVAGSSGFFKLSNSSLTGGETEQIAVSEGQFNGFTAPSGRGLYEEKPPQKYHNLAGAKAEFKGGEFQGLIASGGDYSISETNIPDAEGGPVYTRYEGSAVWRMYPAMGNGKPLFWGYSSILITYLSGGQLRQIIDRGAGQQLNYVPMSYTLVDTAAEPVPEPLTFAGTALALAGLSWFKSQKKRAV